MIVSRSQCPQDGCDSQGKDNLAVYQNGSAHCFACGYHNKQYNKDSTNSMDEGTSDTPIPEVSNKDVPYSDKDISYIIEHGEFKDLPKRKLSRRICEKYGIRSIQYGGQLCLAFPSYSNEVIVGFKLKYPDGSYRNVGDTRNCDMFGSNNFGDTARKTLIITEGELDSATVCQLLGDINHCTSLRDGAASAIAFCKQYYNKLSRYDFIVLCFDMDEPGQKATQSFISTFNMIGKVKIAKLPLKDANDMHMAGRDEELKWAILKAEAYKPPQIVDWDSLLPKILEKPQFGHPWPWASMTNIDHGYYQGKTYLISSATDIGKCLDPNTEIIRYDGTIAFAKDIKLGDLLMGPDSKPRTVLSLSSGKDQMYKVTPKKGVPYIVNSKHILTLKACWDERDFKKNELYDIPIEDYLYKLYKNEQRALKSIRSGIKLPYKYQAIDPYIYGLWLGDGTSKEFALTNADPELLEIWCQYINDKGAASCLRSSVNQCYTYRAVFDRKVNPLLEFIRKSIINNEKRILPEYLYGSLDQRLDLLAGLIDSDGYLTSHKHTYEIATKFPGLKEDLLYLARSVGLMASASNKYVKGRCYYRIFMTGKINKVPVVLERKKAPEFFKVRADMISHITVEPIGLGDYCGFELNGDGRFLLGDFQITHNSTFIKDITFHLGKAGIKGGLFYLEHRPEELAHKLLGSVVGHDLEQPDTQWWDKDIITKEIENFKKHFYVFDPTMGIELSDIIQAIYYFVNVNKISYVVLDNLTILSENRLLDGKKVSEQDYLVEVGKQFNKLKRELNVSFFIIAHLSSDKITKQAYVTTSPKNKKEYSEQTASDINKLINPAALTWERGRKPSIENIHFGATVAKLANEVWVLSRDTLSEDDFISRTTIVNNLKVKNKKRGANREFELVYDLKTGRLLEFTR